MAIQLAKAIGAKVFTTVREANAEFVKRMGADVIIAVNVGTPLLKREQLNGILGVTGQMLSILTEQNVQASLASLQPQDILISPELGDYSTGDFDSLPQIAPLGEAAARKIIQREYLDNGESNIYYNNVEIVVNRYLA